MSSLKKNSVLYLVSTLILNGSSFLLLPLYTSLLRPDEYGAIFLIQTTCTILSMLTSLQINSSISRYYFKYNDSEENVKGLYSTIVYFIFAFTTIIYTLLFVKMDTIFFFIDDKYHFYLALGLVSNYLVKYYSLIITLLYAKQEAKMVSLVSIIIGVVNILMSVVFVIWFSDKLFGFYAAVIVSSVFQFLIFLFYSRKYLVRKFEVVKLKEYISYSTQRLPTDLSSWVVTFSDRIMINVFLGVNQTGIYSVGYKLGQIPEIIYNAINKAYVPYVFNHYSKSIDELDNNQVINSAQYVFTIYLFIAANVLVFSKEAISFLDPQYSSSIVVMIIVCLASLCNGVKLVFHCPMDYKKEYGKVKSVIWTLSAIINVVMNIILIPRYGIIGAALSTLVSFVVTLIPILYFSNKAMNIKYKYKELFFIMLITFVYCFSGLFDLSMINFVLKLVICVLYTLALIKINNLKVSVLFNLKEKI